MSVAPPSSIVSSSSTLWATASKEWVIPPKPKPGRKPKKDMTQAAQASPQEPAAAPTPPSADATTLDAAGRRVQNRAAQRAFRERKQSQLAELQARIQQYEQGEIERNVALQQVAKRLKEENDQLREENTSLKDNLIQAERDRDTAISAAAAAAAAVVAQREKESKRSREELSGEGDCSDLPLRKRSRIVTDDYVHASTASVTASIPFFPSPPSLASSPSSSPSDHCFSPVPEPQQQQPPIFTPQISLGGVFDFQSVPSTSSRPPVYESAAPMDTFDCGFCSDNNPCVCRELALQARRPQPPHPVRIDSFKIEALDDRLQPTTPMSAVVGAARPSILDNLPAYQPPVPLRRRAGNPSTKSLFPVVSAAADCSSGRASAAACSGDPSNCSACADDVFGKAFCTAVGEAVASQAPCADCPSRTGALDDGSANLCCGIPNICGGCKPSPSESRSETIPTSEAWRQIKSHPNVAFADLALLADVVARRTKCTGPTVVIEPAPGSFTPERCGTPDTAPSSVAPAGEMDAVLLSDPHAHYKQKQQERSAVSQSPPPRLVPHDELLDCARRRVRVVHADGVRDALRMLDAKFGQA